MQLLPLRQLARNCLLRVPQFATQLPQLVLALVRFDSSFRVDALTRFIKESKRPAIRATEGGIMLVEGVGGRLYLGDEGVRAGKG